MIDLAVPARTSTEIVTGLHASALAVSPDGRYVVCANAASDNLSVIDTRTDAVVETIWAKPSPADLFGAQPNALAFDAAGRTLYVANGTQNAVAVVAVRTRGPRVEAAGPHSRRLVPGRARLRRATPHACTWPTSRATRRRRSPTTRRAPIRRARGFNSHQYHGSLSLVPVPGERELRALTSLGRGATSGSERIARGPAARRGPASRRGPSPSGSASRA